jgi:hypothetical protein
MRVTTGSQAFFSDCGYIRSKQWIAPRAPPEKLHLLYRIMPSRSEEMAKKERAMRVYCSADCFIRRLFRK